MAVPVKTNIKKNIGKTFSMGGLGTGLGRGTDSGGLGLGTSTVSFFGIQASGERIAFIIDLSRSMVEDDKGGLNGITVLKDELKKMVENLNDGTFFNLLFFDDHVDLFQPKLVVAKPATKKEADTFDLSLLCGLRQGSFGKLFAGQQGLAVGDALAQLPAADAGIETQVCERGRTQE